MKKVAKKILSIGTKLSFLTAGLVWILLGTLAQAAQEYQLLEPIPGVEGGTINAGSYFTLVYKLALTVSVILAILMIVIGGIEYVVSGINPQAKTDAKSRIWGAIGGLLLALMSWIILYEINPNLVSPSATFNPPPDVVGGETDESTESAGRDENFYFIQESTTVWGLSGAYTNQEECEAAKPSSSDYPCKIGGERYLETVIRKRLYNGGVTINRPEPCIDTTTECTSVSRLPERAIAAVTGLKNSCGCTVVITGGTEPYGHQTHGPGKAVVDLRQNQGLNDYLENNGSGSITKNLTGRIDNGSTVTFGGGTYRYEQANFFGSTADHWHVVY